jgi:YHS domain-containing protein
MAFIKWRDKISDVKENKLKELDQKCKEAILGRFSCDVDGVTYYFSGDTEAQANFADAKSSWMDGDLLPEDKVPWTAYDTNGNVVRLQLNKAQFDPVNRARVQWKLDCIGKYRDTLIPRVAAAQTVEELQAVTWED